MAYVKQCFFCHLSAVLMFLLYILSKRCSWRVGRFLSDKKLCSLAWTYFDDILVQHSWYCCSTNCKLHVHMYTCTHVLCFGTENVAKQSTLIAILKIVMTFLLYKICIKFTPKYLYLMSQCTMLLSYLRLHWRIFLIFAPLTIYLFEWSEFTLCIPVHQDAVHHWDYDGCHCHEHWWE